jgi:hypothetical protein
VWLVSVVGWAGVGLEGGDAYGFELGEQLFESPVVVDPALVVGGLVGAEPPAGGFGGDFAGPLPVGAVTLGRVGVAAAVGPPAAGVAFGDRAGQDHAGAGDGGELGGDVAGFGALFGAEGHGPRLASGVRRSGHVLLYSYSMNSGEGVDAAAVGVAIGAYRARGADDAAVSFARQVVGAVGPSGPSRARALLWACSGLAAWGASVGLEARASVLLHPSVIERFVTVGMAAQSVTARRTARTNLRFVALGLGIAQTPAPRPLPRSRAKPPYTPTETAAYFALAAAQPTEARRQRLRGLLCLGLGAGLERADLREVTGAHVVCRSGGVVVVVEGRRARAVPVLARYQAGLVEVAAFVGDGLICAGISPSRKNVTSNFVAKLAGGADLAHLDVGRLRATWLCEQLQRLGVPALLAAAGVVCSQRLGDLARHLPAADEATLIGLLG